MKNQTSGALKLWLILWFISPPLIYLRNKVMKGDTEGFLGGLLGALLIMSLPWLVVALIGWFILKFIYKSVTSGKEIGPKHAAIVWLVIFLILFSFPLFRNKQGPTVQPQISKEYAPEILNAINETRAKKGIPSLQIDERLCAYAKRRALQYQEKVVVPGGQEFELLELEKGPEIDNTYFKDFSNTTEAVQKYGFQTVKAVGEFFTKNENKGAARLDLTHGCVAEAPTSNGTGTWAVFIGGVKK